MPREFAHIKSVDRSVGDAASCRARRMTQHGQCASARIDAPHRAQALRRLDRSHRRRRAAGFAARRGRKASSATSCSRYGTGAVPPRTCTTRSRPTSASPTVNANGLIYGATEESTDYVPVLDPVRHIATEILHPVRDPATPSSEGESAVALAVLGRHRDLGQRGRACTTRCSTSRARVWFTARVRPPENPAFCRKGSSHPSAKAFPIERSNRHLSMFDPKTQQVHAHQHVLPDAPPRVRRRREPHAVDERRRGQPGRRLARTASSSKRRATKRARRAGRRSSSTPTATAGATSGSSPTQPVDPTKDKRIAGGLLRRGGESRRWDRSGARRSAFPASLVRVQSGIRIRRRPRSPKSSSCRSKRTATACAAWTSTATASCGRRSRAGISRASTAQMQRPAERPESDRQALSRRLDAVSVSRDRSSTTSKTSGSVESSYYTWVDQFDTLRARHERADRHRAT